MKKLRPEIKYKVGRIGLFDLMDNWIKEAYNITDEEYDYICDHATDEELHNFLLADINGNKPVTFSEKRIALGIRNKYLNLLYSTK
jgi:hypothetical protein